MTEDKIEEKKKKEVEAFQSSMLDFAPPVVECMKHIILERYTLLTTMILFLNINLNH